jgi:hypothetical protein
MLTENQKSLIEERKGHKNSKRQARWKAGDYALRQHLKKQLDSMSEILEIFEVLPDKQLKSTIDLKQISDTLKVIDKLLEICPPHQVTRTPEDGLWRVSRRFTINMGARVRGLNNALTGADVSYLANGDEKEYWNEMFTARHSINTAWDNVAHDPKRYTHKEFNDLIKPIIETRKDVKITPGEWTVGDPKEDFAEVDCLTDAQRKVVSLHHKKMLKEKEEPPK